MTGCRSHASGSVGGSVTGQERTPSGMCGCWLASDLSCPLRCVVDLQRSPRFALHSARPNSARSLAGRPRFEPHGFSAVRIRSWPGQLTSSTVSEVGDGHRTDRVDQCHGDCPAHLRPPNFTCGSPGEINEGSDFEYAVEHTSGDYQLTSPRTELIPLLLGHDDSLRWSHARDKPQATVKPPTRSNSHLRRLSAPGGRHERTVLPRESGGD